MSYVIEAAQTLLKACEIMEEYGAIYQVEYVGFHGITLKAESFTNTGKQQIDLPRQANKRELRKIIEKFADEIAAPNYY